MIESDPAIRLVLFFSRGIALHTWESNGSLEREVALYRRLQAYGVQVSFVTYGGAQDLALAACLPGIHLLCNRWALPARLYRLLIPVLHGPALRAASVFKTNQLDGAAVAVRAARLWRKPLIARCGYMWSEFAARGSGPTSPAAQRALRTEARAFRAARLIVVTTDSMAAGVTARLPAAEGRVRVVPNYVETDRFAPLDEPPQTDVLFVGRMVPEKNLASLLEAVLSLGLTARVVGQGPLKTALRAQFPKVEWCGAVPNSDLPRLMNQARLFVLPSLYEGHPKALIEAMACGRAVLGADSPGIREVIQHRTTGWLCAPTTEGIAAALRTLLDDPALCRTLGDAARQFVLDHYALDRIVDLELAVLREAGSAQGEKG